jgi:hypothetical protein
MWRTLLWFVLKLVIVSIVLYVIWEWKGQIAYALLFRRIALPVYGLLGIETASLRESLNIVVDRFYNVLPFLSLMVAMWGIGWRRRVWGIVAGFAIIIIWHVCFTLIVRSIVMVHQLDPTAYRQLSPWFLFSDALPLLLWVTICHASLFATLKLTRREASRC